MTTNLFFDDICVFRRDGLMREYGAPEFIEGSEYSQPGVSVGGGVCAIQAGAGYELYMNGWPQGDNTIVTLAAESCDGIHWRPRNTARRAGIANPRFENQLLKEFDGELSMVIEDPLADEGERVKAFLTVYDRQRQIAMNSYLVSPDGVNFRETKHSLWRERGAEPGMGGAYRAETRDFAFIVRPDWGVRRLYSVTTADFINFSRLKPALSPDSEDEPLAETYGMPIIAYKGMYIGFLWLYHPPASNGCKYLGGHVDCQLAYSADAVHWKRGPRRPFIGNAPCTYAQGMVFPSCALHKPGGGLIILASASKQEHGDFNGHDTAIIAYALREDGFVCLKDDGAYCSAYLRAYGDITINLACARATCAVLDARGEPYPGLSHADCQPFSGDSTAWRPRFSSGAIIPTGVPIMLELRLEQARLYAISGDFENLTTREASRAAQA